jgi:hypothetical protein
LAKGNQALAAEMKARDQQQAAQYQTSLAAAKEPSAAETQNEKDRAAFMQWRDKGDYRQPAPTMIGLTYGPEAMRRRQLEQTSVATGAAGMGMANANPTALAMQKQHQGDINAEGDANAYQGAINDEYAYQRTGNASGLMNADMMRKMGLLNTTATMQQSGAQNRIQTQPQSILPMLLSGLMSGASSYFAGGFAKKP